MTPKRILFQAFSPELFIGHREVDNAFDDANNGRDERPAKDGTSYARAGFSHVKLVHPNRAKQDGKDPGCHPIHLPRAGQVASRCFLVSREFVGGRRRGHKNFNFRVKLVPAIGTKFSHSDFVAIGTFILDNDRSAPCRSICSRATERAVFRCFVDAHPAPLAGLGSIVKLFGHHGIANLASLISLTGQDDFKVLWSDSCLEVAVTGFLRTSWRCPRPSVAWGLDQFS